MRRKRAIGLLFVCLSIWILPLYAETNAPAVNSSRLAVFIDPEDGMLDTSAWLSKAQGFLAVPILITEPAVGYGGGLTLLFFHDSLKNRAQAAKNKRADGEPARVPPPSITGVGGFGTANGSWGGGAFHLGIWKEDTIRYLGVLGYASINYDFYNRLGTAIPVNVEGAGMLQQMVFRLGKSDFFAGANYRFTATTAKLEREGGSLPPPAGDGVEVQSAGASGILEYDSRDNIFTPNRGLNSKFEWTHYDDWLGSDNQFDLTIWKNRKWIPLANRFVLGLRADGSFSDGDVPFYMLPFVDIRGIPAMRYQGRHVITAEAELRWDVTRRWSLVGFGGAGWTARNEINDLGDDGTHAAGGFGFRYLVARLFNLRAGLDIGFSEEDTAVYITTGNAW